MFTPWNKIRSKKYTSPDTPLSRLWQNSYNLNCAIPLGPTPYNVKTVSLMRFTSCIFFY